MRGEKYHPDYQHTSSPGFCTFCMTCSWFRVSKAKPEWADDLHLSSSQVLVWDEDEMFWGFFFWICSATKWIPVRFLNERTLRNKLLVMGVALFRLSFASTYEKVFSWMLKLCTNERFVVVFTPRQSGLGYFICVFIGLYPNIAVIRCVLVPRSSSWI